MAEAKSGLALTVGGLGAVLASACCLGPLVLVSLGLGGAWLSQLTALDPYRPYFLGAASVALFFAYRSIFRPRQLSCEQGRVCARPSVNKAYKILFWVVAILVLIAFAYPLLMPLLY